MVVASWQLVVPKGNFKKGRTTTATESNKTQSLTIEASTPQQQAHQEPTLFDSTPLCRKGGLQSKCDWSCTTPTCVVAQMAASSPGGERFWRTAHLAGAEDGDLHNCGLPCVRKLHRTSVQQDGLWRLSAHEIERTWACVLSADHQGEGTTIAKIIASHRMQPSLDALSRPSKRCAWQGGTAAKGQARQLQHLLFSTCRHCHVAPGTSAAQRWGCAGSHEPAARERQCHWYRPV